MSTWKRAASLVFAICMAVTVMAVPDTNVYAKAKLEKANVNILIGNSYIEAINVIYSKGDVRIKNIKTDSKNLIAKQTRQYYHDFAEWDLAKPYGYASIGVYALKAGSYTVKFDVCNAGGKKVSSHSVKIKTSNYNDGSYPVKKVTFNGRQDVFYKPYPKTSGKFNVVLNKGYQLQKIEIQTYDKDGKSVTKTIKNNAKVTLGSYAYKYEYDYKYEQDGKIEYWNYNMYTDFFASTSFKVYYKDTKTKETGISTYNIYRMPKN